MLAGTVSGLISGLFGVGGGIIVVPVLIIVFQNSGFSPSVLTHIAIATSLAIMLPTAICSSATHHFKHSVDWRIFRYLAVGIFIGAIAGVETVVRLRGDTLQNFFGVFTIIVAIYLFFTRQKLGKKPMLSNHVLVMSGSVIGYIATIFGIGGGTITVPLLLRYGLPIQKAIGTSSACMLPVALVGTITNIILGLNTPNFPKWTTGYIYWPAFVGVVITSIPAARIGVNLAHKLPARQLKLLFGLLLLAIGLNLLLRD